MSNNVSIFTGQTGVSTERRQSALAQKLATTSTVSNRRIQANINGTFKKIVNGEQVGNAIRGEFNAIVVGMLTNVSRIYYKEKFDPVWSPRYLACPGITSLPAVLLENALKARDHLLTVGNVVADRCRTTKTAIDGGVVPHRMRGLCR